MAASNKKLGRGLGAIFGDNIDDVLNEISAGESEIKGQKSTIPVNNVRPNPYQPRKVFNDDSIKELSESIKEHGVFQPILVRESIQGYELIAGERRLRASKLAGLKEIPAITLEFNDTEMMEISLLENIQREDLSAIEEAEAYQKLIENLGYTQEELAKRISKSRSYVTNTMRLLKLPSEVKQMVQANEISYGHARALINIEDEDEQIELAKKTVKEGLTVRAIEKLSQKKTPTKKKEVQKDPYLEDVRLRLEKKFNTSIEVDPNKMVIHYTNTDDLNRILEMMQALEETYDKD